MSIAQNIRYLRKKQGWGQDTLAEKLNYKSYTTIQKWESGVSEPPLKMVHALAELFHVDINDLVGTDLELADRMEANFKKETPSATAQKIHELRVSQKLTLEQVANEVGVGKSTVRKWETGMIANMRRDKIAALAKALHTTPEYLMGWSHSNNETPVDPVPGRSPVTEELSELDSQIMELVRGLSEEHKRIILAQLRGLTENR